MQNKDVFKNYGSEQWVIEQNLCFMLQEYWEKAGMRGEMPINPVSFVKSFMKEDTYVETEYAEKSKMAHLEDTVVIDVDASVIEDEVVEPASYSPDTFKKALEETSQRILEPVIKAAPSDQYGGVVMTEENLIRASRVLQNYGSERKPLENWKDAHNKYPGLNVSSKAEEVTVDTEVDSVEEEEEER